MESSHSLTTGQPVSLPATPKTRKPPPPTSTFDSTFHSLSTHPLVAEERRVPYLLFTQEGRALYWGGLDVRLKPSLHCAAAEVHSPLHIAMPTWPLRVAAPRSRLCVADRLYHHLLTGAAVRRIAWTSCASPGGGEVSGADAQGVGASTGGCPSRGALYALPVVARHSPPWSLATRPRGRSPLALHTATTAARRCFTHQSLGPGYHTQCNGEEAAWRRRGVAWRGFAWRGVAWRGFAWRGFA